MLPNIKLFFIGFITIATTIFAFLFKRRGDKIEEQKEVIEAKDQTIETQKEATKSEAIKDKVEDTIKEENKTNDKVSTKSKKDNIDKIYNTPDNIDYKVEV